MYYLDTANLVKQTKTTVVHWSSTSGLKRGSPVPIKRLQSEECPWNLLIYWPCEFVGTIAESRGAGCRYKIHTTLQRYLQMRFLVEALQGQKLPGCNSEDPSSLLRFLVQTEKRREMKDQHHLASWMISKAKWWQKSLAYLSAFAAKNIFTIIIYYWYYFHTDKDLV